MQLEKIYIVLFNQGILFSVVAGESMHAKLLMRNANKIGISILNAVDARAL